MSVHTSALLIQKQEGFNICVLHEWRDKDLSGPTLDGEGWPIGPEVESSMQRGAVASLMWGGSYKREIH